MEIKSNFIDRIVGFLSPSAGARRLAARARIDYIQSLRSLNDNYNKRRTARIVQAETPNYALEGVENVRNEIRQMYLTDSVTAGIIRRLRRSTVGKGLIPQVVIKNHPELDKDERSGLEMTIEQGFDYWAKNKEICDIEKRQSLYLKMGLVAKKFFEDGEVFLLIVRGEGGYSFAIQMIEADRVTSIQMKAANGNPIIRGIEVDQNTGAPVAIYLAKNYELQSYSTPQRIPIYDENGSRQVYHLYNQERPEQYRGYPGLSPAIKRIQDRDRYVESEMTASIYNSTYGIVIKSDRDIGVDEDLPIETNSSGETNYTKNLTPGFIQEVGKDEDIKAFEYNRPTAQYQATLRGLLEEIAFATGIPYSILFQDMKAINFSSARFAGADADKVFKDEWREFFIGELWDPVFFKWLKDEIVSGRVWLPGTVGIQDISTSWMGPKNICFDPNKEQDANEKGLKLLTTTLAEISSDGDWQDIVKQRIKELKFIGEEAEAAGVEIGVGTGKNPPSQNAGATSGKNGKDGTDETK